MRLIPKSVQQGFQAVTEPFVDGLIRAELVNYQRVHDLYG